ncbi:MAG: cupin domain-containing protein, partial [Blastocatellia bacterium]|nr:cupin domain-containing protein [Blastocatellia bacterium]
MIRCFGVCCPEATTIEPSSTIAEKRVSIADVRKFVIHESERAAIPTGDRSFHLLVHKDLGCERVTQFLGVIQLSRAPFHYRTYEEAMLILQGSGIVWVDDENCEFGVGTSIYLPPGQRHCLENPGLEEVRLL